MDRVNHNHDSTWNHVTENDADFKVKVHHSVDAINTGPSYKHHRCYRPLGTQQCKCECIGNENFFQSTPNRGSSWDLSSGQAEVVCGRQRNKDLAQCSDPGMKDKTEKHEVRCCSDTAKAGWRKHSNQCPYAESKVPVCFHDKTFFEAKEICQSEGARLCTADELTNDCTVMTGCMHDKDLIWSSTTDAEDTNEIYNPWNDQDDVSEDLENFWNGVTTEGRCIEDKLAEWETFETGTHGKRTWGPYWGYKCDERDEQLLENGGKCFWQSDKQVFNTPEHVHGKDFTKLRAQFKLKGHQHWFGQLEFNDKAIVFMRTCDGEGDCGRWYGGIHRGNTPNAPEFTSFYFDVAERDDFLRDQDSQLQTKVHLENSYWLEEHVFDDLVITGMCD